MRLRTLVGSGDRIGLFALPFVVVGVVLNIVFPEVFDVGGPLPALRAVSVALLLLGLVVWAWTVVLILRHVPEGSSSPLVPTRWSSTRCTPGSRCWFFRGPGSCSTPGSAWSWASCSTSGPVGSLPPRRPSWPAGSGPGGRRTARPWPCRGCDPPVLPRSPSGPQLDRGPFRRRPDRYVCGGPGAVSRRLQHASAGGRGRIGRAPVRDDRPATWPEQVPAGPTRPSLVGGGVGAGCGCSAPLLGGLCTPLATARSVIRGNGVSRHTGTQEASHGEVLAGCIGTRTP